MSGDDRTTEEVETAQLGGVGTPASGSALPGAFGPGTKLHDGRYVLERRLGRGGMATVWLAWDERLERPVAIKVLSDMLAGDEQFLARFRREARVSARLQHPNLVTIYDFGAEDRPYLVMEYVEGETLAERISRGRSVDPERLAQELLSALAHIHRYGILHRDVKPQNVLLGRDGRARLSDFGIARPRDATAITRAGHVLGTERYIAPEVLRGEPAEGHSDLYSLGVVLAEAAPEREEGGWLSDLIESLLAEDPFDRPPSASAALARLERRLARASLGEATQRVEPPGKATQRLELPVGDADEEAAEAGHEVGTRALGGGARGPGFPAFGPGRLATAAIVAVAAIAVALVVAFALGGGDGEEGGKPSQLAKQESKGDGEGRSKERREAAPVAEEQAPPESEAAPPESDATPPESDATPPESAAGVNGYDLNAQGFALMNQGRYEQAIPLLGRAVAELEGSAGLTYAYALYNLGHSLRLAGRPEEAIPILEQRLKIPNQTDVVRAELEAARADAR